MGQRFVYRPLSSGQMTTIGALVIADVSARIRKAINCQDVAAKPLKPGRNGKRGYPDYKSARGLQPKRDLTWTGRTMRSIGVIKATANEVRIGFVDPVASKRAAMNQNREAMFWFSPSNRAKIQELVSQAIRTAKIVLTKKAA